ncbi:MAG: YihY/virulence factor BrkB family protein [Rickettsiales bacterium]
MIRPTQRLASLFYRAARAMGEHHGSEMAGHLTFLSLLALFPYMVLVVALMGVMGQGESGRQFVNFILTQLPPEAVVSVRSRIIEIISGPPSGLLTFAAVGALWTSSSAVDALRAVLNRANEVRRSRPYFSRRLWSVVQLLVFTLLILVVMLVLVFTPVAIHAVTQFTGIVVPLHLEHFLVHSFKYFAALALFLVVASFYYWLPNLRQSFMGVVPGAALVVVAWIGGASGVGYYLTHLSQLTPIYGSLSGFIGTLIFFYVMILIFIFGAEFNHQLALARGVRIVEREHPEGETLH